MGDCPGIKSGMSRGTPVLIHVVNVTDYPDSLSFIRTKSGITPSLMPVAKQREIVKLLSEYGAESVK